MDSMKIGNGLTQAAISAALARRNDSLQAMRDKVAALQSETGAAQQAGGVEKQADAASFSEALVEGIRATEEKVQEVEQLPMRILNGELQLHEAATKIQASRIAFQFSMEVRNKFIEAYREVMRMPV